MKTNKEIVIEVTRDDIFEGFRNDARSCPIARAIKRALGFSVSVRPLVFLDSENEIDGWTGWKVCRVQGWYQPVIADLPREAADAAAEYDDNLGMEPFRFVLEV